jgi:hypothetical protein
MGSSATLGKPNAERNEENDDVDDDAESAQLVQDAYND